ncbi:restriction endonuclease subunit S [Klebsiella pneumoniae]|jgi:type I restriction enzyme S subunit|uniref:restriction endonuclease subunit S n=1 Tax=Klebsiella pneumoniae TaxID=573 RepID=UPI0019CD0E2A|nr:restriction endonuclease subunit S [Klebsiella pneumoniae]MBD7072245.1 restriction endonuclease subunit S [Klebsiella pneumoniae]MDP1129737.1 restriction endonuclease subunit S [Klebsiella pneumoniae]
MSELSYLEKLLDGAEVEWKTLEKVLKRTKGTKITAGQMKALHKDNAPLKIFAGGKTVAFVDFKDIPEKDINREPSIIVKSRGIIEFEYYDKPFSHKNEMWSYHSNNDAISIKYIYYFLKINEGYFQKIGGKMQMPQIATPDTDKFEVPIPCPDNPEKSLAIQSEIVRILDTFTALTAELTAELTMRKKQYNYYRDQLLSFDEGEVEWKTLEEVLVDKFWIMPATPKFDDNGEIPYVTSKNISGGNIDFERVKHISRDDFLSISKNRPILKGDFLISMIGTIGEIARVKCLDPDFYGQNMYLIRLNEELLHPRYFLHFFDSPRMKLYFKSVKNNSGQGYLKANNIDGLSIPLPSIDEQQKIAFILDKFDTLTNSINEGLPREIELRQKQYEYYRDLLFSFPKPDTVNQ